MTTPLETRARPSGAGIAERLRRWTYGDYDTHAVLSMAGERVATVPLIAHAEALMADAWDAASHIEAQAAEIERLRAELDAYRDAAMYDVKMDGAVFSHWNRSQLDRARAMTEAARKAEGDAP